MRIAVFLCAVLATTLAVPNGYYHQEYRSQSSSSAYKNDELQHKTDDESFYSKHGDVEGRSEPKVNSYSQHLEYQNPNRGHGASDHFGTSDLSQRAEDGFSQFGSGSSMRQMQGNSHNSRRYYGSDSSAQRGSTMRQTQMNPDDLHGSVSGNRKHYSYSGSYSISGANSGLTPIRGGQYDTPSNLQTLTQQLQDDMSTQLQSAIARQHQSSSYSQTSSTVESDMRDLERELKTNLTRQLQEKLNNQYGIQGKRGAYSYSITSGNYNPQANYNNQELDDLTAELQRNLMQQLETGVRNEHSERSSSSSHRYQSNYGAMHRPRTPTYVTNVEITPVVNPSVPLLDVTTGVQNDLDREVNTALHSLEQKYLIEEFSERPDHEAILLDLQNQLKRNLTIILDEALTRTYGRQEQRGSYFFNTGSSTANYKVEDLDNLKQQIESNLVKKITQVLNEQTTRYSTRRQQHESHSRPAYRPSGHHTETLNTHDTYDNRQYQSSHHDQIHTPYNPRQPTNRDDQTHTPYNPRQPTNRDDQIHTPYNPRQPTNRDDQTHTPYNPRQPTNNDDQIYTSYATYHPHKSNERVESNSQVETTYEGNRQYGDVRHTYRPNYETTSEVDDLRTDYNNRRPAATNDDFQYSYNPSDSQRPYGAGPNTQTSQTSQRRDSSHSYTSGSRTTGVEITPNSQVELVNIRQELQNDLSQQIQDVINKQRQQSNSYSSSTSFVPANNQIVTELSEELKRNLTQKLEEVLRQHYGRQGMKSGYAFTITTSGAYNPKANYNVDQITDLTNQVQEDLLRQLREGLTKQSYQSSQSSSSSTVYKPMVTYGTYGAGSNRYVTGSNQYGTAYGQIGYGQTSSTNTGELDSDCMQNDDNFTKHQHDRRNETIQPIRGDQAPKAQSEETHVDLEVTPSEGLEDERPKQHPGQAAQTLIDSERAEDLTQQIEDFDLNQHVQEPNAAVHVGQQDVDEQLTFGDHDLLLTQQTEDQVGQSQLHFGTLETGQDLSQKPQPGLLNIQQVAKHDDLSQKQDQFEEHHLQLHHQEDLTQQAEVQFNQHQLQLGNHGQQLGDLSQQPIDDFNQEQIAIDSSKTDQQLEGFSQQQEEFSQQLEDQHLSNFNQQLVETQQSSAGHDDTIGKLQTGQQFEQFPQQHEDDFAQQLEQQQLDSGEQHAGLTQQTVDGFDIAHGQQSQSSYSQYSQHTSNSYSSLHNKTYSSSLTVPSQVVYATVHQTPVETSHDLEQQRVDEEVAHVVQDVSHQAETHSVHSSSSAGGEAKLNFAKIEEIETTTAATEKPGFWKRLGGKITNTYKKAKDKISEQLG